MDWVIPKLEKDTFEIRDPVSLSTRCISAVWLCIVPGDMSIGYQQLVVKGGMAVRLCKNMDKDRGFVNGAIGSIWNTS